MRVLPSGNKLFLADTRHGGKRSRQTIADANAIDLNEARSRAEAMPGFSRGAASAQTSLKDTLFESVAETVFQRYTRIRKPADAIELDMRVDNIVCEAMLTESNFPSKRAAVVEAYRDLASRNPQRGVRYTGHFRQEESS